MKRLWDPSRWLTRMWWAVLLLLAFSLPFEFVTPWLDAASILVFTNVELVAAAALALWLARQIFLRQFPTWRTPLTLPIGLLLLTLVLASAFAPGESQHAFKVTTRWFVGAVVFWMLVNAIESGLPVGWLIRATVLGGVIAAGATVGEALFKPIVQPWLAPFRIGIEFQVGGELRASGTLAFPTIAAMYFECILFFVASALGLAWSRRHWVEVTLLIFALVLVAGALVSTLTRSALAAVAIAAVVVVAIRYRKVGLDLWSRAALLAVGAGGLLLMFVTIASPTQQLRLVTQNDTNWYRAQIEASPLPTFYAGESVTTTVRVKNVGLVRWESSGENPVNLLYHWQSPDGTQQIEPEGLRTPLGQDVAPGESAALVARIRAPARPGKYVLAWDMAREGLFWFSTLGAPTHQSAVTVVPARAGAPLDAGAPAEPSPEPVLNYLQVDRLTLWRAAGQMLAAHPLFGVGPGNFRLVLGSYLDRQVSNDLHANNTYLELLADAGAIGGLAFLVFVLNILRLWWKGLNKIVTGAVDTVSRERTFWLAGVAAALAAFLLHAFTDYFLEFTSGYLLFWSLLAFLVSLTRENTTTGMKLKHAHCV